MTGVEEGARPRARECATCGVRLQPGFRFCPSCGVAAIGSPVASDQERRPVAVLFCDLVDFSSMARSHDPERLRELLTEFFDIVRDEITAHGGLLEKYVGDAVVAMFGFPEAHDDDVDRALHAALALRSRLDEHNLRATVPFHVRVGVHTGEAVLDLTASPDAGQGFAAGYTINLAQRLQSVAPIGGIVVSHAVVDQARDGFTFVARPTEPLKGEPLPFEQWSLLGTRTRPGRDVLPIVDRRDELAALVDALDQVVRRQSSQVVVISGEPGIGKSRLVAEVHQYVGERRSGIRWRRGRCLPYGHGVTMSAVSEVMKQDIGALDSDPPEVVADKLRAALHGKSDGEWVVLRLLPILGLSRVEYEREELFAAWSEALMIMAGRHPAVVVIEDVHWADDAVRVFLEQLTADALPVPLLVVATSRPHLLHDAPGWPGARATHLRLGPLPGDDVLELLELELGSDAVARTDRALVLERAAGNPLFAREYARLVRDQLVVGGDAHLSVGEVPPSIQALLAARLDTLSLVERGVVQCASVVGKVFWSGAVAYLSRLGEERSQAVLDSLVDHGLVRRRDTSSMQGQTEYAFTHALLRDVTYDRAPFAWRRDAHLKVLHWIEQTADQRRDEVAEVLAHHAQVALELATDAPVVREQAAEALRSYARIAARRAALLDSAKALGLLDRCRSVTPPGHPDEAEVLLDWAEAAQAQNRLEEALAAVEAAEPTLRQRRNPTELVRALILSGDLRYQLGDVATGLAADREAAEVARTATDPAIALEAVANLALTLAALGDASGREVVAECELRAADLSTPLPLPVLRARGILRLGSGEAEGLTDLEAALQRAEQEQLPIRTVASAKSDRADALAAVLGPGSALQAYDDAVGYDERFGLDTLAHWTAASRIPLLLASGDVAGACEMAENAYPSVAEQRIGVLVLDAWLAAAIELADEVAIQRLRRLLPPVEADGQEHNDVDRAELTLILHARLAVHDGDVVRALGCLTTAADQELTRATEYRWHLTDCVRWALSLGQRALAVRLATQDRQDTTLRGLAQETAAAWLALDAGQLTEAEDAFRRTAGRWQAAGHRLEHAACMCGRAVALGAMKAPDAASAYRAAEQARRSMRLSWPAHLPSAG